MKLRDIFALHSEVNQISKLNKQGAPMMKYIPVVTSLMLTLVSAFSAPDFVAHHVAAYAILNAVAQIIHAVLPSVAPKGNSISTSGFILLLILGLWVAAATPMQAQSLPANVYAFGVSGNPSASPSVAGTAFWAHQVTDNNYSFTAVDAVPSHGAVVTSFSTGLARKVLTVGKIPIYAESGIGPAYGEGNIGWDWTGGVTAPIRVKGNWRVFPTVRYVKSSVSNGTGYQIIPGLLVGWGQ